MCRSCWRRTRRRRALELCRCGELGADGTFPACSIGGEQSPIDLTGAVRAEIEPPAVSWRAEAFRIVNNGHTIQANASPGGFATSAGRKYELQQFLGRSAYDGGSAFALEGERASRHSAQTRRSVAIGGLAMFPIG